ncbi:GNAT family N-acetyltransferase [Rhodobacterales bacterium]|nr:GNAT family N-acetyltransferase [Rhodobacterales bacterium]
MTADADKDALEVLLLDPRDRQTPTGDWQELCDEAIDPNPFFSPGFLRPFLTSMSQKPVRLAVVREKTGGRWLAAMPVGGRRAGLAIPLRSSWSSEYGPVGLPLLHPDATDAAVAMMVSAAAGAGGLLAIPYLPLVSQTAARLRSAGGGRIAVASVSERACHDAGALGEDQFENALSGKKRKEMRRLLRRLADHGEARFDSVEGAAAAEAFEAFLKLEASGWKGRGGSALASREGTGIFSRAVVDALAAAGRIRIDQLWAGETLVAALVLIIDAGNVFAWKIAFDEAFARYSPGSQLALEAFRRNLAMPGFRLADSLAIPGHSMIEPLWRGRLELGTMVFAFGPGASLKLSACLADIAAEQKLRAGARAIRSRLRRGRAGPVG